MELHLYDFDGTLFRSPHPPDTWSDKGGWWSDSISLSNPCVPVKPDAGWWNEGVVAAAKKSISNPEVLAVLCTGRQVQSFARYRVPELLHQKGLNFDAVYLKPSSGSTDSFKKQVILKLLALYQDIQVVHIFEDRLHHLEGFCQVVEAQGVTCVPHPIRGPEPVCEAAAQRLARRWLQRMGASRG